MEYTKEQETAAEEFRVFSEQESDAEKQYQKLLELKDSLGWTFGDYYVAWKMRSEVHLGFEAVETIESKY